MTETLKAILLVHVKTHVEHYIVLEAFSDLVLIGILEGSSVSGILPMLVVNSPLIACVLSTPQASEDPLTSELPILMACGCTPRFVVFAFENTGCALRNYPHYLLVSDGGGEYHSSFFPLTSPHSPCCPSFLFDLTIISFLVFMSDVCRVRLGK